LEVKRSYDVSSYIKTQDHDGVTQGCPIATRRDTYGMDPGPNQSSSSTPPPPPPADAEHIELQVLPAAAATTVGPLPGNADPEDPEENEVDVPIPLGVKLTTYRLLNMIILLAFGLAKFILSLKGQSAAPTGLEWVAGSVFAALWVLQFFAHLGAFVPAD
jgi:hypothetical protein